MAEGEMSQGEVAGLVAAAQQGDEAAWRTLVARYVDLVWSIARGHSLSHCDAADVTQTTWLRLHEQLPRLTDPSRVGAWLATTARRESLRILREQRREAIPSRGEHVPAADDSLPIVERERDRLLWESFGQLTPECQTLLRAMTAEPRPSYAEVSAALGMPVGSIGPRRARCLDRLRANLLALSSPVQPGEIRVTRVVS